MIFSAYVRHESNVFHNKILKANIIVVVNRQQLIIVLHNALFLLKMRIISQILWLRIVHFDSISNHQNVTKTPTTGNLNSRSRLLGAPRMVSWRPIVIKPLLE